MKTILYIFILVLTVSCSSNEISKNDLKTLPQKDQSDYLEQKVDNKWIPDSNTLQELLALQNTVENFNLLKTKMQTVAAYNEYGHLLQLHIERINNVCTMKGEPLNLLKTQLEELNSKIPLLQTNDIQHASDASNQLTETLKQIQESFRIEY